eukprot:5263451-Pyramimonas_sp.AAC.1
METSFGLACGLIGAYWKAQFPLGLVAVVLIGEATCCRDNTCAVLTAVHARIAFDAIFGEATFALKDRHHHASHELVHPVTSPVRRSSASFIFILVRGI